MPDLAISDFPATASIFANNDIIPVVDVSATTTKGATLEDLFGNIPAPISGAGSLTITGNTVLASTLTVSTKSTVTSNNATTQFSAADKQGTIFWDDNYLYVATSPTKIRRIAFTDWQS